MNISQPTIAEPTITEPTIAEPTMTRPTISQVSSIAQTILNQPLNCPITKNKGAPGLLFEKLTGIPTSSACLDCLDGEVKIFPLKTLKNGEIVPKETVAITMMNPEDLNTVSWDESRCKTKISNLLFVGYLRDGDNIIFKNCFHISEYTQPKLYELFKKDYEDIQQYWKTTGEITSKIGVLIQSRTKGPGNVKEGEKKTRAFYFRPTLMKGFMNEKFHE